MEEIKNKINDLTERIIDGRTIGNSAEVTHGLTNQAIGQIEGLKQLVNITFAEESEVTDVSQLSGY